MKNQNFKKAFAVVQSGYDQIGESYSLERKGFDNKCEVDAFLSCLPQHARVLDAGSGTGIPIAERLAQEGYKVVGIDLSATMVTVARKNVPGAEFHQMNMTAMDFPPESFDGVISCYAIIHTPKELHETVFRSFHDILKPKGVMLVSVACWEWEETADYLGVDMFWSHYSPSKTEALIKDAGFDIEFGRRVEGGGEVHHWVLAHKN
ncbi:MAG: class I SAM-dependent methyltransferase [candidate division Zixibacteria bacterium]|nr:class I SAM-dependent methyltransferase [candidate division Zixibacteria bacterium]